MSLVFSPTSELRVWYAASVSSIRHSLQCIRNADTLVNLSLIMPTTSFARHSRQAWLRTATRLERCGARTTQQPSDSQPRRSRGKPEGEVRPPCHHGIDGDTHGGRARCSAPWCRSGGRHARVSPHRICVHARGSHPRRAVPVWGATSRVSERFLKTRGGRVCLSSCGQTHC